MPDAALPAELGPVLGSANAFERRYMEIGDLDALDEAVDAWEQILAHPAVAAGPADVRAAVLNNAGGLLLQRYWARGHNADLDAAVRRLQEAVTHSAERGPGLAGRLANLGVALRERYQSDGRLDDLRVAVEAFAQAIEEAGEGYGDRPGLLNNLGLGLTDRYLRTGLLADLERAIAALQEAVDAKPVGSLDWAGWLSNLSNAVRYRYKRTGRLDDLDRAIDGYEAALAATPQGSPERPSRRLSNLGNGLRDRYARTGNAHDLDRAIEVYEQAVAEIPAGSPDRPGCLTNLGDGLRDRFARAGEVDDLERAIALLKEAVTTAPATSPDRPRWLSNLGTGLRDRYGISGSIEDLHEAVAAFEQALAGIPADAPDHPAVLNNLGDGLRDRYNRTGEPDDLDRAIRAYKDVTTELDPGSPDWPGRVANLANALRDRYVRTRSGEVLDQAIGLFHQAVARASTGSPDLARCLDGLAISLLDRYAQTGDRSDLEEGTLRYEQACGAGLESDLESGLAAGRRWGQWASANGRWSDAAEAYGYARQAVTGLFRRQLLRWHKEAWLREAQGLPARAAYALTKAGDPDEAVVAVESGRAQLLSEALERDRADLGRLPDLGHGEPVDRYRRAVDQLAVLERTAPSLDQVEAAADRRRRIGEARQELQTAITAIRRIPGYERFLDQPTLVDVQAAAGGCPLVYLAATPAGGLALIVRQAGQVTPLLLPALTEAALRVRVAGFQAAYRARRTDRGAWLGTADAVTSWLWGAAMAPLLAALGPVTRVALVPAGLLGMLPLHAAWVQDTGTATGRQYVLDRVTVSYAPNARALTAARRIAERAEADRLLAVDEPSTSDAEPLPFSAAEVAAATSWFEQVKLLRHEEATAEEVLGQLAAGQVHHFSCHGKAYPAAPLDSALLLANRPLTLREVLDLRLAEPPGSGSRLAILSACETDQPGEELPDEVVNLPTGLLQAGLAGVVGTQWAVPGAATAMLMARFYEGWRGNGLEPAAAVREAQRWVRDTTNVEKVQYFTAVRDAAEAAGRSGAGADTLRRVVHRKQSQERSYAHLVDWAAFAHIGI